MTQDINEANSPGAKELKELESLIGNAGEVRSFIVNGEVVKFQAQEVLSGKIPDLIKAAGPLMFPLVNKGHKINIEELVLYHTNECLDLLAVLVDQPRDVINKLKIDDMMVLFGDCIKLNLDFFVRRVLPLFYGGLARLMDQMQERKEDLLKLAGQTQPNS